MTEFTRILDDAVHNRPAIGQSGIVSVGERRAGYERMPGGNDVVEEFLEELGAAVRHRTPWFCKLL